MPFKETCRVEERIRMLRDWDLGVWNVAELCRRHGVSRDTFYEWHRRRESGAVDWYLDRSHATHGCPHRTAPSVSAAIIAVRQRFPYLGPAKLLVVLEREKPGQRWPAASTIGDTLKRAGLVQSVKRPRRRVEQDRPFAAVAGANEEWSTDFKGWFRSGDGRRLDPLTIADSHSRFLIDVRITAPTGVGVRPVFEAAFRRHGLPLAIRCDNGTPFGSSGAGGLTRLSAWWLRLGIDPRFVRPGSPQDNGRHERMHRTLKQQTSSPPAKDAVEQQSRFDAFRHHFNEERPHQALGQVPPATTYQRSLRPMPDRLEEPWYDAEHQVRRVRSSGEILWRGGRVFISEALIGEIIGIAELENGSHVVRFCDRDIGVIGPDAAFRRFAPPRPGRGETAPAQSATKLSTISPV